MGWDEYQTKLKAALELLPGNCTEGACLHQQLQCVGETWQVVFVSCDEPALRKPCGGAAHLRLIQAVVNCPYLADDMKIALLKS